jgi:hypothetical protein
MSDESLRPDDVTLIVVPTIYTWIGLTEEKFLNSRSAVLGIPPQFAASPR